MSRERALALVFGGAFYDPATGAFRDTTDDSSTHPQDGNAFAILAGLATSEQERSVLAYLDAHERRTYGDTVTDSRLGRLGLGLRRTRACQRSSATSTCWPGTLPGTTPARSI